MYQLKGLFGKVLKDHLVFPLIKQNNLLRIGSFSTKLIRNCYSKPLITE